MLYVNVFLHLYNPPVGHLDEALHITDNQERSVVFVVQDGPRVAERSHVVVWPIAYYVVVGINGRDFAV